MCFNTREYNIVHCPTYSVFQNRIIIEAPYTEEEFVFNPCTGSRCGCGNITSDNAVSMFKILIHTHCYTMSFKVGSFTLL